MHTKNIAYLDAKIDNILLDIVRTDEGRIELRLKLADFGMSQMNLH